MAIAGGFKRRTDYVLGADREKAEAEQTVFHLKRLRNRVFAEVIDRMTPYVDLNMDNMMEAVFSGKFKLANMVGDMLFVCVRVVDGWTNYKDADGGEAEFKHADDGTADEECIEDNLELAEMFELAQAGLASNQLGTADKKKS